MKKMYLMKGMAVLAMGLVAASCNKLDFDQSAYQQAKEQESQESFMNNVMGGQSIDANQTWKTTKSVNVTVTPRKDGILKIYTANPIGNVVAPLYTTTAVAGQEMTFTVTRPTDVETLYAAVLTDEGLIADQLAFNATEASVVVDMNMPESSGTRAVVNSRRAMPSQPTFRSKPAMPTIYKNTLTEATAAGATAISGGIQANGVYYMTPSMSAPDIQNTPLTIYFDGDFSNNAFTGSNYQNGNGTTYCVTSGSKLKLAYGVRNNLKIYLAPNAELDLTNFSWDVQMQKGDQTTAIYLSNGSKLKLNSLIFYHGTILNEGGTITANKLQITDGAVLYNNGTVDLTTGDGYLNINNTDAEVVNYNILKAKNVSLAAGSKFHNTVNGVVTVSGATDIKNESNSWMNDGRYTSGSFTCWDTQKVYNNCRLTVTGKFKMNGSDSQFVLNGEASLICDSFDWESDNAFWLGGGSYVKVANTLKFNNSNDGERGFFQSGNEYAVISAKAVTTDYPHSQWRARYSGKIYVDADSHFDFYELNQTQKNIYTTSEVVFTKKQGTAPVNWNESTCRPAYKGGVVEKDPIMYYYYAFEDLGAIGDFDFNDVVLRLAAPDNAKSNVQLVAAGGTLPAQVIYSGNNVGEEVHKEFGVDTKTMVNTGSGEKKDFVDLGTVDIAEGANMAELPFGIKVTGNNGETVTVTNEVDHKGTAPLMIVVAGYSAELEGIAKADIGKWFWARERVNISSAYSQFGSWGANVSENQDWYYYFTEGKVWKY